MHLVDVATRMQLTAVGQVAAIVPFVFQLKRMLTLYKGAAALAARRDVASKLTHSLIAALKRPRRVDKVRDHLAKVDDAVKLAKKLDANSPAKRWATIMAKADAPSAPAAKSERLPPLAVAVAVVAAAYVVRALFAKE